MPNSLDLLDRSDLDDRGHPRRPHLRVPRLGLPDGRGRAAGDVPLTEGFRRRALCVGILTGVVALAGVAPLRDDAPTLFDGLTGRALPVIVLSALAGTATLAALWSGRVAVAA